MLAALARLIGVPPIAIEAVVFGLLLLAFAGAGFKIYDAGFEAADSKCEAAALQSQLDAVQKDRDDARAAAAAASLKLAALEANADVEKGKTADYVAELEKRPAPDKCGLTCDDLRGLRIASKSCPADPRPSAGAGIHGAGQRPFGKAQ
ncbi:hypothetical protein HAP41_0000033335 [Bradyrhizobium barranii subsp. apii]|uniref:Uncharacterized protein n=1 Tax=Bradyrhizobium barranii subsp. apii TaxID=2819348 RepID=A0A8T5V743_9BRAD|nr:hypothetical protein [Bradyrhizobium barranii]UPT85174.1 hypothetical protein HAP41_0000033335 [Bradyrhizobium barranii subsp. apii]